MGFQNHAAKVEELNGSRVESMALELLTLRATKPLTSFKASTTPEI
jgi:hypothetical protein